MDNFHDISGSEALLYGDFLRHFAMRERVNDIMNLKVFGIGDIQLPRNSLFHYMPALIGEVGPSNSSPFINTYPGRVDLHFYWDYVKELEKTGIKIKPVTHNQIELGYFKSHFAYNRARQLEIFLPKEIELVVNNIAPAFLPVVYIRRTIYTGFIKYYNETMTLIEAVNKIAEISNRHQFFEINLPNTFPSYQELKYSFSNYTKFFDEEGNIKKFGKEALRVFHANRSYWLLDLYALLLGFEHEEFSIYSKLSPKAKENCNFIFSHSGKCVIANIQTLTNLMGYGDKDDEVKTSSARINRFKRFYLNLISLVTNVDYDTLVKNSDNEDGKSEETSRGEDIPEERQHLDTGDSSDRLVSGGGRDQGDVPPSVRTEGAPGIQAQPETQQGVLPDLFSETPLTEDPDDEAGPKWGDEVDDALFEQVTVENNKTVEQSSGKTTPTTVIERMLKQKAKEGKLTNKERDFFLAVSKSYENIDIGTKSIAEIIDIKPKDMAMKVDKKLGNDSDTIVDKSVLRSRVYDLSTDYINEMLNRNVVEMITHVQNGGVCLTDLKIEPVTTARSKYDVWTMKLQPIDGNAVTRSFRIPRVQEDGTFTIDNVKSYFQLQRMEKPIRKISSTAVQLTSYYDKPRIIVERSPRVVDRYDRWLRLRVINAARLNKDISITLGSYPSKEKGMCYYYSILASRFKEISVKGYDLNFDTKSVIGDDPVGKELCNESCWVVGKNAKGYITIDSTGMLSVNNQETIGYFEQLLDIDLRKAPLPLTTININGYKFPVVIVLSYWMGFSNLLKLLNVEYRVVEPNKRPELEPDEYVINFADERMIFNRRDELSTLVISGLSKIKNIANYSRSYLDDPNVWFPLMDDPRIKPTHFKEMTQIFDMFIDPITKRLLAKEGYPTVMNELVISAIKLLLTEYAPAETEITEQRFVGYERFSGHIYRELCTSVRQFRNKPAGSKRTFDFNPEAVMLKIITDSSRQAVEDVNPFHQCKQQEEVTYGGTLGRAEQAMVRRTRGMHANYTGVISEAGKDSGKVGFVTYLTVDPKIVDLYGNVDVSQEPTKSGLGSVTLNTLYGLTRDDTKRAVFAGVQKSQMMATYNYAINPIRMSYDAVMAQRNSEMYSSIARKDGVIKEVDPENGILVTYDDGTEGRFELGLGYGKGGGEYHRHNKVTDMAVGDKFKASNILAWDELFFDRDPFNKGKVVIKYCVMTRIALFEDQTTFEDSIAVVKDFCEMTAVPFVKQNSFKLRDDQIIKMHKKVGDEVSYDDIIADISDPTTDFGDSDAFAGTDRFGIKQERAGINGKITKVEVFYNGEIEDFSPETQRFIKQADKSFANKARFQKDGATNGNVGGNTSVGKMEIYPGTIKVDVYIEERLDSTTADKLVIGNQMKGTIGYIYPDPIYTNDGRPVHMIFSTKSQLARMVLSMRDKMVCNELNNVYTHRLIERIEGKTSWVM